MSPQVGGVALLHVSPILQDQRASWAHPSPGDGRCTTWQVETWEAS